MTVKCLLLFLLQLSISIVANAQIRTDYKEGMVIPDEIDLKAVAPKGLVKFTLVKPFADGFYTLIAELDNYRNEKEFIRLMNFEVKNLLSKVWGVGTLAQKKARTKEFLFSLDCTFNKNGYIEFTGSRWHDDVVFDIDDQHYIYPVGFDRIITLDDTKDKYFGRPSGFEKVLTDLLPQTSGITHLEMSYNLLKKCDRGIIIQTNRNYANQYYFREISREEMDEIEYTIAGNYPRKIKEDYICSKLIAYGVNTIGQTSSKWLLFQINKRDGFLDLFHAVPIQTKADTPRRSTNTNYSVKSVLFDFIRSKFFTKQEQEWYNKHFTKEQLDAMTGFGLGIATGGGGNGQFACGTCGRRFSNQADLRSHQNADHDY